MDKHSLLHENPEVNAIRTKWPLIWIRLTIVFILGFLTGFILFTSVRGCKKNPEVQITGKQVAAAVLPPGDSLVAAEPLHYDSPLAKATCKVRYSEKIVEVRIDLSSLYPVKSLLEFDVNNFSVLTVRHVSVNDQSNTMTAANYIQFNSVGDNKYTILLSNNNNLPHKFDFTISQNDVKIYQNFVEVNK